jgi:transposase
MPRLRKVEFGRQLMPPAYVKAYVKRNKNDAADAEAICEAVTRSSMRFVPVKEPQIGKTRESQGATQRVVLMGTRSANSIRASGHMHRTEGPDI